MTFETDDEQVAKPLRGQQSLFADESEAVPAGVGTYGQSSPRTMMQDAEDYAVYGAEVMDRVHALEESRRRNGAMIAELEAHKRGLDAISRADRLERAVRRAIELIQPDRSAGPNTGSFVNTDPMRALAVLRGCLIPETADPPGA
jgi:hypothetical protein